MTRPRENEGDDYEALMEDKMDFVSCDDEAPTEDDDGNKIICVECGKSYGVPLTVNDDCPNCGGTLI